MWGAIAKQADLAKFNVDPDGLVDGIAVGRPAAQLASDRCKIQNTLTTAARRACPSRQRCRSARSSAPTGTQRCQLRESEWLVANLGVRQTAPGAELASTAAHASHAIRLYRSTAIHVSRTQGTTAAGVASKLGRLSNPFRWMRGDKSNDTPAYTVQGFQSNSDKGNAGSG